jgi:5-methylcytosine-specific restriction endonuclease McrBC regulatory subunit McrC
MVKFPILYEHQSIRFDDLISDAAARSELKVVLSHVSDMTRLLKFDGFSITTSSWVGVVVFGGIHFQVLPKLLADVDQKPSVLLSNLTYMLSVTEEDHALDDSAASIAVSDLDLIDTVALQYASGLLRALKRQPILIYVQYDENLTRPRGRVDLTKTITLNYANRALIYCNFDELTPNNPILQTMKFVALKLKSLVSSPEVTERLNICLRTLESVDAIKAKDSEIQNFTLNRQWAMYEQPWRFAKLFLKNLGPNLSGDGIAPLALEFDMNKVFEGYITYLCERYAKDLGLSRIYSQARVPLVNRLSLLTSSNENITEKAKSPSEVEYNRVSQMDLVLETDSQKSIVIDTKYKRVSNPQKQVDQESESGNIGLSDLYQLFTYGHLRGSSTSPSPAALIYPRDNDEFRVKLSNSDKNMSWYAFTLDLHTDLRENERELVDGIRGMIQEMVA